MKYITNVRKWELPEALGLETVVMAESLPTREVISIDLEDYEVLRCTHWDQMEVYCKKDDRSYSVS